MEPENMDEYFEGLRFNNEIDWQELASEEHYRAEKLEYDMQEQENEITRLKEDRNRIESQHCKNDRREGFAAGLLLATIIFAVVGFILHLCGV